MKIRMTGIIVVMMMLAMVSGALAFAVDTTGNIDFVNGTPCPSSGWSVYAENLDRSYTTEPWSGYCYGDNQYFWWDYLVVGEAETTSERLRVWVESTDKRWYGENTSILSLIWDSNSEHYVMDIVVQERPGITKPLPEGWNLISLPMTPTDNSTGAVLSGVTYNAVKLYNATSKAFEAADTMDPGIGYFVHVTNASTWQYCGTSSVNSTSTNLKSGLNMIGVPNCAMDVSAAMGSADYRYVARWNATGQEYEVYNKVAPPAFHHFTTMELGEGYFVSAQADDYILDINCP